MINIPSNIYSEERLNDGSVSPKSVADRSVISGKLAESATAKTFIEAPQKFFGKYIELDVGKRTLEEKEANQAVRKEFHGNLHAFFGPLLAEYLYPQEQHEKFLQKGAPLTPEFAQKIVSKGMEMMEALANSCIESLGDEAKKLSQPDLLDQAMVRYADEQEALVAKQGGIIDVLPHTAKAVAGGAMAAFAVATMGHLTPTDIFFLADLLADKKLSKSIENFITARLVQHIEHHLESYLEERRSSNTPLSMEEEKSLRTLLMDRSFYFSRESAAPAATSVMIRAENLSVGGGTDVDTPIGAINYILFSPMESVSGSGAHSRLFRDGVTMLIGNIKKIQDSMSETTVSAEELSKIKRAIAVAGKKAAAAVAEQGNAGTWRDVSDQELPPISTLAAAKNKTLPPPWRRGI
ncbi:MAG: hypothetical protein FJ390_04755 [Verrucomicrobia bacterium]|nr:hypothetical protein [Verrucomicrobiota bacterium]